MTSTPPATTPSSRIGSPTSSTTSRRRSPPLASEALKPEHSAPVTLKVAESKVPEGYERPINHFVFDLTGSGLVYEQGDSLGVYPTNSKADVEICLKALKCTGDEMLHIRNIDSTRSVPLPEHITVRRLLTEILDIGGWPKRRFYEMLKMCATDAKEKEELTHLCSREGKEDYQACAAESYTYAELLRKFPS